MNEYYYVIHNVLIDRENQDAITLHLPRRAGGTARAKQRHNGQRGDACAAAAGPGGRTAVPSPVPQHTKAAQARAAAQAGAVAAMPPMGMGRAGPWLSGAGEAAAAAQPAQ